MKEVSSDLNKEAFQSRAFFVDTFLALKQDRIRKLDVATFRAIQETYIRIDALKVPSNIQDINRRRYKETIEAIEKTTDLLK